MRWANSSHSFAKFLWLRLPERFALGAIADACALAYRLGYESKSRGTATHGRDAHATGRGDANRTIIGTAGSHLKRLPNPAVNCTSDDVVIEDPR